MYAMFEYSGFNSDISKWDVSSVINMERMLYGATSFNQDLCAWGDKFPYDNADGIFAESGCNFRDTPQLVQRGPFCASNCTAPFIPSPTVALTPTANEGPSTVSNSAAIFSGPVHLGTSVFIFVVSFGILNNLLLTN